MVKRRKTFGGAQSPLAGYTSLGEPMQSVGPSLRIETADNVINRELPEEETTRSDRDPKPSGQLLRCQRLIEALEHFLPTVALDEPSYDPLRWRGGAWLNINLLVAETAAWAGLHETAEHLAGKSLAMVASQPGIWEHYDVGTGEPGGPATFGMTAAACIEFAIGGSTDTRGGNTSRQAR